MTPIQFKHWEDFGHEWFIQVLNTSKHYPRPFKLMSVLQVSIGWCDFPSNPYLRLELGQSRLFGLVFFIYKFSFNIDILSQTWHTE